MAYYRSEWHNHLIKPTQWAAMRTWHVRHNSARLCALSGSPRPNKCTVQLSRRGSVLGK